MPRGIAMTGRILGPRPAAILGAVAPTLGWTLVVVGMAFLALTWLSLQYKVSQVTADLMTAAAAVVATCGGLLVVRDVSAASWVLGPSWLAVLAAVVHRRALFRGAGPVPHLRRRFRVLAPAAGYAYNLPERKDGDHGRRPHHAGLQQPRCAHDRPPGAERAAGAVAGAGAPPGSAPHEASRSAGSASCRS